MKFLAASILGFAFGSTMAVAGHENGNGGDVVVCANHQATMVELLDYFEARVIRGIEFDVARPSWQKTVTMSLAGIRSHYVEQFVARVAKFDAAWAKDLERELRSFVEDAAFVDFVLMDVPDSFHLGVPEGCRIEQAAVQRSVLFPEDKPFIVARQWWGAEPYYVCPAAGGPCAAPWSNLTTDDAQAERAKIAQRQAGLMIHEVILRRALELGQTNSIRTRYFHSYVMSSKYHALTAAGWAQLRGLTGL